MNNVFSIPDYFKDSEFERVGCKRSDCNPISLDRLNRCRHIAGIPFILTSAFRSPSHEVLKGRSCDGAHTTGQAFDISCNNNTSRYKIIQAALQVGFFRIGIGKNFIHLDDCDRKPHPRIWHYY